MSIMTAKKFFEADESEIGSVFLLDCNGPLDQPHTFLTYIKVEGIVVPISHHTLSGLQTVFGALQPGVSMKFEFDEKVRFLFSMRGQKRIYMWQAADKDHLFDQMDGIVEKAGRKKMDFEIEDVYGKIEKISHKLKT